MDFDCLNGDLNQQNDFRKNINYVLYSLIEHFRDPLMRVLIYILISLRYYSVMQ